MKKHKSNLGYTVIELMLTALLLSIFTVSLVSSMSLSQSANYSAMLRIVGDIRYAQNRAMVTGTPHGFITLSNTQYRIYQGTSNNPTVDPSTQTPMEIDLSKKFPGVNLQGTYQIEFNSVGTPTLGGGTAIVLQDGTATQNFSVANNTGVISLP